jgi:anhydro-N-acetylmuramic acid kinase
LQFLLPETRVMNSSELGIDPDAKEALAFAILANETWHLHPANVPSVTGAHHPVILGKITPA